jgi:hypothetical protein
MASSIPTLPAMAVQPTSGVILLLGMLVIVVALLAWWWFSAERKRGLILPLTFLGAAICAVLVEPVFDNTLLYAYPAENPLAAYVSYERAIPWFVPIGYAWFFGGAGYLLMRRFEQGITVSAAMRFFLVLVGIDWFAVSICQWADLSAFYGNQPYQIFGSPLWFSVADATGGFLLGAALYALLPHLAGARQLLLLLLPTFVYGGVLGSTTAPVSQALNSNWSVAMSWFCGTITIALCMVLVYVAAILCVRNRQRTVAASGGLAIDANSRVRTTAAHSGRTTQEGALAVPVEGVTLPPLCPEEQRDFRQFHRPTVLKNWD